MAKNIKGRKFVATAASAALVASAIVPVASAAGFGDQSQISDWAADAVAHAVEKGYMQGTGGNFNPKATITKAEVATVLFNALDLKEVATGTFTDVPADAWYAGEVNALQAAGIIQGSEGKFEPTKEVTLAEAAVMVANALKITGTADLSKFADAATVPTWANSAIQALVSKGYIEGGTVNGKLTLDPLGNLTRERLATMFVNVAKKELEVKVGEVSVLGASAINLAQVAISFDQVLDKTSAELASNYTFDGAALTTGDTVTLLEDGKTVVLTLLGSGPVANQSTKKVTVKNVKSKAGATIKDYSADVTFTDFQAPTVVDVVSAGPDSFKVIFSEPVKSTSAVVTSNYVVNEGQYFVQSATVTGLKEVTVKLYSTLPDGTYNVEIKNVEDLAGFKVATTTKSFAQVADTTAPTVAKVVSASPEKVVLEFTEDIIANDFTLANVYHTNANNTPNSIVINPNNSKQLVLTFTTNKLPQGGTAYLVVKKDVVKDGWNNKNAEYTANISVTIDNVKPTVEKLESETDKSFKLSFSEEVTSATATVASNYTVLDPSGKKVDATFTATLSGTGNNIVTLTTGTSLPGGQYTVVVENVKDLAGNTIDKVSNVTTVKDTTAPTVEATALLYGTKKIVKVEFSEAMATTGAGSVLDLSNYRYGGDFLNTTKATITLTDNGKAVLIDFSKTNITLTSGDTIKVGKVSDVTGNATAAFESTATLTPASTVGITSAAATGPKTVVVKLEDALSKFVASDFVIESNGAVVTPASVTFTNVDGKGQITFTLQNELSYNAKLANNAVTVTTIASPTSENAFGVVVGGSISAVTVADKIAPTTNTITVDGNKYADVTYTGTTVTSDKKVARGEEVTFTITYTEAIDPATVAKLGFTVAGFTVASVTATGDTVVITANANANNTSVLTSIVQVSDIADMAGNVLKASNTSYTVVRETPAR